MRSIHARVLIAGGCVLFLFLGAGALVLDNAFRSSLEEAARTRLGGLVYGLLSAADEDAQGRMRLADRVSDPRFSTPDSGLYAEVVGHGDGYLWRSASLLGRRESFAGSVQPGEWFFEQAPLFGEPMNLVYFSVAWENLAGEELHYTFSVAESRADMHRQMDEFRGTLLIWLGGAALLLLLVQGVLLRWGLKPLRRIAVDLGRIEAGESEGLTGQYPTELSSLTGSINSLIQSAKRSQERYRNSLGNLAHSLKTPLAVLQGALESRRSDEMIDALREQVPRMDGIVQHQLKRAAVAARVELPRPVPVEPVIRRLCDALGKVYRNGEIECQLDLDEQARFFGDEGDLMEVAGNLIENAFKYCRGRVEITIQSVVSSREARPGLVIRVADDGDGIEEDDLDRVLYRGERVDQRQVGQGIGLSVADEIVRLYGGELRIGRSASGGALFEARFPGRLGQVTS